MALFAGLATALVLCARWAVRRWSPPMGAPTLDATERRRSCRQTRWRYRTTVRGDRADDAVIGVSRRPRRRRRTIDRAETRLGGRHSDVAGERVASQCRSRCSSIDWDDAERNPSTPTTPRSTGSSCHGRRLRPRRRVWTDEGIFAGQVTENGDHRRHHLTGTTGARWRRSWPVSIPDGETAGPSRDHHVRHHRSEPGEPVAELVAAYADVADRARSACRRLCRVRRSNDFVIQKVEGAERRRPAGVGHGGARVRRGSRRDGAAATAVVAVVNVLLNG